MEQPAKGAISKWLEEKCKQEHLSLRQAADKTGLSHATIGDIIAGAKASPETIRKLARAFGGNGKRGLALEDKLLVFAGHRSGHPGEELTEPMARLLDKLSQFNEPQLRLMEHFADFISKVEAE